MTGALGDVATAGTLTFLFSDIEGSTRLEQALGTSAYAVDETDDPAARRRHAGTGAVRQGSGRTCASIAGMCS